MTDEWDGGEDGFDDAFFTALGAGPDDSEDPFAQAASEETNIGSADFDGASFDHADFDGAGIDHAGIDADLEDPSDADFDPSGTDAFLYEVEGDGSFETEGADHGFDSDVDDEG